MPSNLPVIKVRTNDETIIKMKYIAKFKQKSLSKLVEELILKEIWKFETEHGEIKIDWMSPQEIIQDITDRISGNPPYEKNNTAQKIAKTLTGVSTGEKIGDAVIKRSKKGNITPE